MLFYRSQLCQCCLIFDQKSSAGDYGTAGYASHGSRLVQDVGILLRNRESNTEYLRFVCTFDTKALGGSPVLLRTYETGTAPVDCKIWQASRATSAAPTFFPPISFQNNTGGEFIDAGVGCNNPTKVLIKEAKSYYRLKGYGHVKPTCIVSIGTGQKDLIQLHKAASVFWFKDRTGLSIAPVLGEIVTDCENTHDEMTLSCFEENIADR